MKEILKTIITACLIIFIILGIGCSIGKYTDIENAKNEIEFIEVCERLGKYNSELENCVIDMGDHYEGFYNIKTLKHIQFVIDNF